MLLVPDDIAIDVSSARPAPDVMASLGVRLVSRYLSHVNDLTIPKILTKPERDRWFDAGVAIQPNWEWYAERTLTGAAGGRDDGRECAEQLAALDWPLDHFVCVSADTDQTPASYQATFEYEMAFRAEIAPRPMTVYKDRDGGWYSWVAGAIDAPGVWLPAASAWDTGNYFPPIYMRQWSYPRHKELTPWVLSRQIDDNTVTAPFRAWAGELSDAGDQSPEEDAHMDIITNAEARYFAPDNATYDPGVIMWELRADPFGRVSKRYMTGIEGKGRHTDMATPYSNAELDMVADWVAPPAIPTAETIREIVRQELGAAIPPATPGGLTSEQVRALIRGELDNTRLTH